MQNFIPSAVYISSAAQTAVPPDLQWSRCNDLKWTPSICKAPIIFNTKIIGFDTEFLVFDTEFMIVYYSQHCKPCVAQCCPELRSIIKPAKCGSCNAEFIVLIHNFLFFDTEFIIFTHVSACLLLASSSSTYSGEYVQESLDPKSGANCVASVPLYIPRSTYCTLTTPFHINPLVDELACAQFVRRNPGLLHVFSLEFSTPVCFPPGLWLAPEILPIFNTKIIVLIHNSSFLIQNSSF